MTIKQWGEHTGSDYTGVTSDTWIRSDEPDRNHGANIILAQRDYTSGDRRSLIKFDISALSGLTGISSNINSATFYWWQVGGAQTVGTPFDLNIHRVLRDWGEGDNNNTAADAGECSWNAAKEGTDDWATAGCDNTSTDRVASVSDSIIISSDDDASYVSFDVTQDVKDFFDGTDNYGWITIVEDTIQDDQVGAVSSDHTTATQRPYLEIDFEEGVVFNNTVSDGTELGDTADEATTYVASRLDGMELGDTLFGGVEFGKTASGEGIVFSDTVLADFILSGGSADTFTVADSAAFAYHMNEALSAGTTWSDSASALENVFQPSAADGISFSDSSVFIHNIIETLSDTLNLGDTVANTFIWVPSAAAGIVVLADVIDNVFADLVSAGDGLAFSDTALLGFNFFVSGGTLLSDSAFGNLIITTTSASDGLVMTETGTAVVDFSDPLSAGISFSDISPNTLEASSSAIDGIEFSDVSDTAAFVFGESISDGFIIGASASSIVDYVNIVLDGITMSDVASGGYVPVLQAIDSIIFSDTGSSIWSGAVSASDIFKLSDSSITGFLGAALTINAERVTLTFVALREE
jgi:hypothetical protein